MTVICSKCNEEKDISHFRKDQHNSKGHHPHCNACYHKTNKLYYDNNLDKVRSYARKYYKENAERISALRKARYKQLSTEPLFKVTSQISLKKQKAYYNREGWKKTRENGWRSAGIIDFTYLQFEEMKLLQDNKCYICKGDPAKNQNLHVDHDHKTGKVRKLLCNNCNNGMGKLKDDVELIQKVLTYLIQHND